MKNKILMFVHFCTLCLLVFLWSCEQRKINKPGNLVPKTADQDSNIPSIVANGAVFHAEAFGNPNDPLLIILHGGPGSDYRYLLRCKEFATQGYRVVFYDQRGAGLSQRFDYEIYNMQILYDDLGAIIRHYKQATNQKVFLLGHSWGAMLATAYINQYPSAVNGVVLAEPGGFVWQDVKDYITRSRKFSFFGEPLNDATYPDQFITGSQNNHEILDYKHTLLVEAENVGNEGKLPHWRAGAVTFNAYLDLGERDKPNWTANLNQYTTKVLFIYSENNASYGLAHAQKVSSAYPNVQLFKTNNAGHDMFSFARGWDNSYPTMLNYFNSLK
jgi:proline iminopeptidase